MSMSNADYSRFLALGKLVLACTHAVDLSKSATNQPVKGVLDLCVRKFVYARPEFEAYRKYGYWCIYALYMSLLRTRSGAANKVLKAARDALNEGGGEPPSMSDSESPTASNTESPAGFGIQPTTVLAAQPDNQPSAPTVKVPRPRGRPRKNPLPAAPNAPLNMQDASTSNSAPAPTPEPSAALTAPGVSALSPNSSPILHDHTPAMPDALAPDVAQGTKSLPAPNLAPPAPGPAVPTPDSAPTFAPAALSHGPTVPGVAAPTPASAAPARAVPVLAVPILAVPVLAAPAEAVPAPAAPARAVPAPAAPAQAVPTPAAPVPAVPAPAAPVPAAPVPAVPAPAPSDAPTSNPLLHGHTVVKPPAIVEPQQAQHSDEESDSAVDQAFDVSMRAAENDMASMSLHMDLPEQDDDGDFEMAEAMSPPAPTLQSQLATTAVVAAPTLAPSPAPDYIVWRGIKISMVELSKLRQAAASQAAGGKPRFVAIYKDLIDKLAKDPSYDPATEPDPLPAPNSAPKAGRGRGRGRSRGAACDAGRHNENQMVIDPADDTPATPYDAPAPLDDTPPATKTRAKPKMRPPPAPELELESAANEEDQQDRPEPGSKAKGATGRKVGAGEQGKGSNKGKGKATDEDAAASNVATTGAPRRSTRRK
ncbi:hypothetical protein RhiLY_06092 [Ceratobasidium sp. AG-Ba]|nr:hypothetical protein RhiLY_06092 [Ceratobasidium sp. AG-Ba]